MLPCASYAAPPAPELPGSANPARAIENNQLVPEPQPETSAPVTSVEPVAENPAPPGADKVMLEFKGITLEGVTVYDTHDLASIYTPYIGKRISLSKIYEFTSAITARYQHDGYVLSKAVLPPQKIGKDGIIRVQVIEGYVNSVQLQGTVQKSYITDAIAERITHYRPLNVKDMERDILLLNDLAGVSVQTVLKPITTPDAPAGAVDMAIVFSKVPFQSSITADNFNSRYVGPYETGIQSGINNILPYAQTTLNGTISVPFSNLQYIQAAQRMPLDSEGTTATFAFAYAHTHPGYTLEPEDIKSDSYNYSLSLAHPFLRSRAENFYLGTGLTLKDIHTDFLESELYVDRLTIANISAEYDLSDRFAGANLFQIKLNQGLQDFGASANGAAFLSRSEGRSDFTDITANIGRLQGITNKLRLYVAAEGQYSWSQLLSSEQFGFGGQQFGRAYDTSELTGDNGMAATAELRYSLPSFVPQINSELFTFYDVGRVWNYHQYLDSAASAASTGAGIRVNENEDLSGMFMVADPLTKRIEAPEYGNGKNLRIFGSLTYKF